MIYSIMLQVGQSLVISMHTPTLQSAAKHSQVQHIKIIKRFAVVGVYSKFLNIISTFLKLVTIQWRIKYLAFKSGLKAINCRECNRVTCYVDIQSSTEHEILYTFFTKRFVCKICKAGGHK